MSDTALTNIRDQLRRFAEERDWEQFHSPKNLAMALVGEAGELTAEFQWLTESESHNLAPAHALRVQQEAADVLLYLIRLADKLDFDLIEAAFQKIERNAEKYPVDAVRGSSKKYTEYNRSGD